MRMRNNASILRRWSHRWSNMSLNSGEVSQAYTPHKAIRRVADHLIDHLAEFDARLADQPAIPDEWHASAIITAADRALFTIEDFDEAQSRLRRLALMWDIRR
jgi:hypothetical protein